jgi:type II secretory pathway pseudopilin PulG
MIHNKILGRQNRLKAVLKSATRLETGFSMLEAVVVVGVLLAIAVGGFFAYGPIVQNAKLAKLKSAASEVYTAATVNQIDGDPTTKPQDALDAWNASSTTIKVGFFDTKVIATPAMTTGEYTPAQGEDFCIQATDISKPEIEAKSGDCPQPADDGSLPPGEILPEETPNRHLEVLKNGDFSEGLTYWDRIGDGSGPTAPAGQAVITPGGTKTSGLSQKISIPDKGITHVRYSYQVETNPWANAGSIVRISAYDLVGNLIKDVDSHTFANGSAVPKTAVTIDLTEFAGQDIKIAFQVDANAFDRTVYFDDISVQNTHEVPSEPTAVTVNVTNSDAAISWNPPIYGDASVTSYKVTPYRNGKLLSALTTTGMPPKTSTIFKGLTNGGDYTFRVTATNSIGESSQSAASAMYSRPAKLWENGDFSSGLAGWENIGPINSGQTVTNGEASVLPRGNTTAGWAQIVSVPDDGVTYARYTYRIGNSGSSYGTASFVVSVYDPAGNFIKELKKYSTNNSAIPKTTAVADLTEFAGQDIKLAFQLSINSYTRSGYLDDTSIQTIATAPGAPTEVKVAVNDADATVSWTPSSSGSHSVTEYTVTPYRNGDPLPSLKTNGEPPATSTTFKGLYNGGTYTFKVTATNKLGTSAQSASSDPFTKTSRLLQNGDFSAGLAGWGNIGIGTPTVTMGEGTINPGASKIGGLYQTISIPAQGSTTVNYAYRIASSSWSNGAADFIVSAYDPSGNLIKEIKKHTATNAAVPRTVVTADLTEFAGQDIKLAFQMANNTFGSNRPAYLDDVSVTTK